jgi:hypothetical protein
MLLPRTVLFCATTVGFAESFNWDTKNPSCGSIKWKLWCLS